MQLQVLLLVLSFISLINSNVFDSSPDLQLRFLKSRFQILDELLSAECLGYVLQKKELIDPQSLELEILKDQVKQLTQKLIECRSQSAAASVTTLASLCPSNGSDSVLNIQFLSYNNPTNTKASGELCNADGSPCTISFEICVSPKKSSSCEFHHQVIDVKKNQAEKPGSLTSPLKINLGKRNWQGVHILITAMMRNGANSPKAKQVIDKFIYVLTDALKSPHSVVPLHGTRLTDKTELNAKFSVPCALPSTTITTSPTTAVSPVPAECLTATNLTQPWRFEQDRTYVRAGGPHSKDGYACDLYEDLGWFRFTGAAGTHMLDTCPTKNRRCGTLIRIWTDDTPPQAVGVKAKLYSYGVMDENCWAVPIAMQVMRCSLNTAHDLIYKYVGGYTFGPATCWHAFCGVR